MNIVKRLIFILIFSYLGWQDSGKFEFSDSRPVSRTLGFLETDSLLIIILVIIISGWLVLFWHDAEVFFFYEKDSGWTPVWKKVS